MTRALITQCVSQSSDAFGKAERFGGCAKVSALTFNVQLPPCMPRLCAFCTVQSLELSVHVGRERFSIFPTRSLCGQRDDQMLSRLACSRRAKSKFPGEFGTGYLQVRQGRARCGLQVVLLEPERAPCARVLPCCRAPCARAGAPEPSKVPALQCVSPRSLQMTAEKQPRDAARMTAGSQPACKRPSDNPQLPAEKLRFLPRPSRGAQIVPKETPGLRPRLAPESLVRVVQQQRPARVHAYPRAHTTRARHGAGVQMGAPRVGLGILGRGDI